MSMFSKFRSSGDGDGDGSDHTPKFSDAVKSRLVFGSDDALFGSIEKQQGDVPFGTVLDAGTGVHSLRWLATLFGGTKAMTKLTAVTADATMQRNVQEEVDALEMTAHCRVVRGNWFEEKSSPHILTHLESQLDPNGYNVILADYLIGAMDGFSPYRQDEMIPKLMKHLKPGGRLYIVGLEPIPDSVKPSSGVSETSLKVQNLICRVRQVRDACILLAGHRCYREYPKMWIERQLRQCRYTDGGDTYQLELVQSSTFPILYSHKTITTQINVGRSKLEIIKSVASPGLSEQMKVTLDELESKSKELLQANGSDSRVKLGFDYVISAEKKVMKTKDDETDNSLSRDADSRLNL